MAAWRTLLFGPVFPDPAPRHGVNSRSTETAAGGHQRTGHECRLDRLVFGPLHFRVLRYHVIAMAIGQCLTAFFAVWTVHHHCDRTHYIARTIRNRIKNAVTFNMFRHIEHHLFPGVPTCHLTELSKRIDMVAPELKQRIVF